jgi:hypothetical protein
MQLYAHTAGHLSRHVISRHFGYGGQKATNGIAYDYFHTARRVLGLVMLVTIQSLTSVS